MTGDEVEPLRPEEAVDMYLDHREPDLSEKSLHNHKYRFDTFLEFCKEQGITNLNNLTGRDLHRITERETAQAVTHGYGLQSVRRNPGASSITEFTN